KDDNWTCEVQGYDGIDYESDWNNATQLIIQNTPPQASSTNITSDDSLNRTNGTLTGVWTYGDNDSDLHSDNQTQWYNNTDLVSDLNNLETINFSNT
ncbi:MAG TPA: hypothetical protein DHN29_13590, partial [Cytophagales bacterium]|nr:hypothetical protein [Cytophagales bacterium]